MKDQYHDALPRALQPHMLKASLKRYFLTGLLIMIPFWGTILILKTLFVSLDGILGDATARLVTPGYYVPGLGDRGAHSAHFCHRTVCREFYRSAMWCGSGRDCSIACRSCAASIPRSSR